MKLFSFHLNLLLLWTSFKMGFKYFLYYLSLSIFFFRFSYKRQHLGLKMYPFEIQACTINSSKMHIYRSIGFLTWILCINFYDSNWRDHFLKIRWIVNIFPTHPWICFQMDKLKTDNAYSISVFQGKLAISKKVSHRIKYK